ncbi:RNA-binding domain-containing protein [Polyangium fumosum]|uniref:Schlafen AlbA-2 domain-containing protein n=1 Tax=Polyangium fumosum TaxID=889272 RepID=A0A4U1ILN7_9BACT|nr:RNA-binding domain-containing protein [Polyangium fumosum]TKC94670.1 hypothetical protein E8A74_47850 [Polyangium fumosum]
MSFILPINIDDLLHFRGVESSRIEFKASWDEKYTGSQVLRTICAFANDLQNLNGGYVVLGVEAPDGVAILPPKGLAPESLEKIQTFITGRCRTFSPEYTPVLSPEVVDGKHILVIWARGGQDRPYQAPESIEKGAPRHYYVRTDDQTKQATGSILTSLMQMTAKVPFDDRRAFGVPIEKLRESRVREFLSDIGSDLIQEPDARAIYRRMFISARSNGHEEPLNVGLLFFSDDPEEWFRGARIEVVEFAGEGDVLAEQVFRGPLHEQTRAALRHLQAMSVHHLEKQRDTPEVKGWVSYPFPALKEALVNAIYHRGYEGTVEPTKVYLYPDRMEVISYPGPQPGLQTQHLRPGAQVPPVPARNRRIGELLKELGLAEGRGTGIPRVFRSMEQNGSPEPIFDFDDVRSYFRVTLPVHPEYLAILALRDVALLRAVGDRPGATRRLMSAFNAIPGSGAVAAELISELCRQGELAKAREVYDRFFSAPARGGEGRVVAAMSTGYLDAKREAEAKAVLDRLPEVLTATEAMDAAILERRVGRQKRAHLFFEKAGGALQTDPRALLEFAQTKIRLAGELLRDRSRDRFKDDARARLLRDARDMLRRVLQMDTARTRHAWASYELGRVLRWLGAPATEVRQALEDAVKLAPEEPRFQEELARTGGGHEA